jgi:predicted RNA-binding protein YlqC (UPF0109 family)
MKDTLLFILARIVDHPDDIRIDEQSTEDKTTLTIHANQEDLGKIIGKSGRIIRSLRDLIKLMAAKQGIYVDVVLSEDQ